MLLLLLSSKVTYNQCCIISVSTQWWKRVFSRSSPWTARRPDFTDVFVNASFGAQCRIVFVQVASLYPTEIKSARLNCECSPVCIRERAFYYLANSPALCPVLSGCTSWANSSRVCIQECVCMCVCVFAYFVWRSLFLYPSLSYNSVPRCTKSVYHDDVSTAASHLPAAEPVIY